MTVLPTVRRQIQQTAERQASRTTARTRPRLFAGALAWAVGVAVAVGVVTLAVVLLGHHSGLTRSPATGRPAPVPGHEFAPRRLLDGDGIGDVRFGQRPMAVAAGVEQLLGRPASASSASPIGYGRAVCGYYYIAWRGLDAKPNARRFQGAHRLFSGSLEIYFKRSRFVGYVYSDDHAIYRGAPDDETSIPLNSLQGRQLLRGPRLTLATAEGLQLGDPLAYARRLYGRALVETTQPQGTPPNPQLQRLPIWQVDTPNGRVYGSIDNHSTSVSFYSSSHETVGGISAGQTLNTPCH
jgi:hypothetical protein